MVQLVVFINLFFIPALPLYWTYKRNKKTLTFSLELLSQYCIIAACNIPLTKVFTFLAKRVLEKYISIDSGYYTLAALISASILYLMYVYRKSEMTVILGAWNKIYTYFKKHYAYYTTYFKKKFWKEKVGRRGIKRILSDLAPAYLLMFTSCFMMLIFEPILLYATNMNDFWFDFSIMIWPVLDGFFCFLLGGIVIVSAIYFVNLAFSGRVILYRLLTLVGFIVFFLLYLQGNWLAGNLPPLTGDEIIWDNYGSSENFILKSALILLSAAAVIFIWRFKLGRTVRYCAAGAVVILVMLISSLIPTIVENEALKSKDTFAPTLENFNTVSSNRNFLIFLVDTVDSSVFYDVMTHDEDFNGILNDFTFYPDTLSTNPHTRDSIPTILTGSVNHNETNFFEYSSKAYNQSLFFKRLEQNEYGINLYSPEITWGGYRNFKIENSVSIYNFGIDLKKFMDQELKYIQFKYLPYTFKKYSKIETLDFDVCRKDGLALSGYDMGNWSIYNYIQGSSTLDKRNENYFHFIHCEGAHTPYNMDKYLNPIDNGSESQKVSATLTMIKAYLQRLKNNGAYDNSVIVIMADHGQISEADAAALEQPYLYLKRCNPILFIKGINEKHEMITSDRPVSYVDLQDAFCDLIDGKQSTDLFTELQPGRTRTVIWNIWTEEYHLVEYETTGTAREPKKFTPTGNVYDLKE